jgi:hypothetical protein
MVDRRDAVAQSVGGALQNPIPDLGTWPALVWDQWKDTAETLNMWTQIVGKVRLGLTPVQNHWWNIPLYVTARGLSTSAMPAGLGRLLDIEFDFIAHRLVFRLTTGETAAIELYPRSVADLYHAVLDTLQRLRVEVTLDPMPVELPHPIRFDLDTSHASYDRDAVDRFWKVLILSDTLFKRFSTNFYGKISPVHFFWGSFDLAVTRFSGRRAPSRPAANRVEAEAYSHEVISAGFWPGNGGYGKPAFYCYAAPGPPLLSSAALNGLGAFNSQMGEFLLDYDTARSAPDPIEAVLNFLDETYDAAANAANWNRAELDRTDDIAKSLHLKAPQSNHSGVA